MVRYRLSTSLLRVPYFYSVVLILVLILVVGFLAPNPPPHEQHRALTGSVSAMRLVVQRVKKASVTVEGNIVAAIGPGAVALVGIHEEDTDTDVQYCCKKVLGCKLWNNDNAVPWRHGLKQRQLELLCVSQFTLYGKVTNKKHQPDYKAAMKALPAEVVYTTFVQQLHDMYDADKIQTGVFGAMMDVELINDGPVTIIIDSRTDTTPPTTTTTITDTASTTTTNKNEEKKEGSSS